MKFPGSDASHSPDKFLFHGTANPDKLVQFLIRPPLPMSGVLGMTAQVGSEVALISGALALRRRDAGINREL